MYSDGFSPLTQADFISESDYKAGSFDTPDLGITSAVADVGGIPTLIINGEPVSSAAYVTYFDENNCYKSFGDAGYRIFSVCISFGGRSINTKSGIAPFSKGIYELKGAPDYTVIDDAVRRVLDAVPEAFVFPRVNISMPEWWERENPDELNILPDGSTCRESLYSEKWRRDAGEMLADFIRHVNSSPYRSRIIGYQISGGYTEEWFHFDLNAGYCKTALGGFSEFLKRFYPDESYEGLPDFSLFDGGDVVTDAHLVRFIEYANFAVADDVSYLAAIVKRETGNRVIAGFFYGYLLEILNSKFGTHMLRRLLRDENIDFFCSPNSYLDMRRTGIDWGEISATASMRLHGKLYISECDVRTSLTKYMNESRPGSDPRNVYYSVLWKGPDTLWESVMLLRKTFARQITNGNGFYWFDMWGGWFEDEWVMSEMKSFKAAADLSLRCPDRGSTAQVAAFVDEASYKYFNPSSPICKLVYDSRLPLGLSGAPYDVYEISDFERVYKNYKAVVFITPLKTDDVVRAEMLCSENKTAYLNMGDTCRQFTTDELRALYKRGGVHILCETDDAVLANESFVALHAATAGRKTIRLDRKRTVTRLDGGDSFVTDNITFDAQKFETVIFCLDLSY